MKWIRWIVVVVAAIFFAALALDIRDFFHDRSLSLTERAKESPLIVYATLVKSNTPQIYVVQEIWKDERNTHSNMMGMEFIFNKPRSEKIAMPDGAVTFYQTKVFNNHQLVPGYSVFVNNGKISIENSGQFEDLTVIQYKHACGF